VELGIVFFPDVHSPRTDIAWQYEQAAMHTAKTVDEPVEIGLEIILRDIVVGFLFAETIVGRPAYDQYVHCVPRFEDTDLFEEIFDVATTKHAIDEVCAKLQLHSYDTDK